MWSRSEVLPYLRPKTETIGWRRPDISNTSVLNPQSISSITRKFGSQKYESTQ